MKTELCWLGSNSTVLDALLMLGYSKQIIKKRVENKKILKKSLRYKDIFEIPKMLYNLGEINPKYNGTTINLIKEKKGVLAISKPSGVHCHSFAYGESDNVLSFLRENSYFEYLNVNKESYERGLLYRLDFETSGLLLISSDREIHKIFRENIKIEKTYLALVEGKFKFSGLVKHRISTSGKRVKETLLGDEVSIEVKVLDYNETLNATLCKVILNQGKRHQIRVQMSLLDHPILGDNFYGAKESTYGFGLHCLKYSFILNEVNYEFSDLSFWPLQRGFFNLNGNF